MAGHASRRDRRKKIRLGFGVTGRPAQPSSLCRRVVARPLPRRRPQQTVRGKRHGAFRRTTQPIVDDAPPARGRGLVARAASRDRRDANRFVPNSYPATADRPDRQRQRMPGLAVPGLTREWLGSGQPTPTRRPRRTDSHRDGRATRLVPRGVRQVALPVSSAGTLDRVSSCIVDITLGYAAAPR